MNRSSLVTICLQDSDGSVLLAYTQPSRSYVQQMIQRLRSLFRDANEANVRETGNTLTTITPLGGNVMLLISAIAADDRALVVGSGNTAVAIDDHGLATQIADGVGAGELQYQDLQATVFGPVTIVANAASFTFPRAFINGSGGDVTVRETGLFARMNTDVPGVDSYCIARDVLAAPVVVSNGQTLTVTYTVGATA